MKTVQSLTFTAYITEQEDGTFQTRTDQMLGIISELKLQIERAILDQSPRINLQPSVGPEPALVSKLD